MNTIPTIFNERQIKRTVVGGAVPRLSALPVSAVLLNRGGRYYRTSVFKNLLSFGFQSVVSVELTTETYDIEELSLRFPMVKFLIPREKVTAGDMVNIGMAETDSEFVLVLWNDVRLSGTSLPVRITERMQSEKKLCIAPVLVNQKMQMLPVEMVPSVRKTSMKVTPELCTRDDTATVYPFDFMGIYNREKFIRLGGFDYTLTSEYWQALDFGFRAWLWGEEIRLSTIFRAGYENDIPQEDITPDKSQLRFYLKNIAPQFRMDHGVLPVRKFFSYLKRSDGGPVESWRYFSAARLWVEKNRFRFVQDAKNLIEMWGNAL